jgi:GT2 family glycosyltransferase
LYLLITRVRDEAKYLPALFQSVFEQTIRPALWVLVDHDSKDESAAIITGASEGKDWIKSVHLEATETYGLFCHARPLKFGFDFAVEYAAKNNIPYDFLGILDADIVAEPAYFEKLTRYMEQTPRLGITGGRLYIEKGGREIPEDSGKIPRGGGRLYRRECFESIGGTMPESANWDTETDILAGLRGWQVVAYPEAKAIHKRVTYSRKGILRGYWRLGKCYYYANDHPVNTLLTGLWFTKTPPFIYGLVLVVSYLKSWLTKGERTQNPEIRDYYRKSFIRLIKRVLSRIFNRSGK